jgi:hypothetical protein
MSDLDRNDPLALAKHWQDAMFVSHEARMVGAALIKALEDAERYRWMKREVKRIPPGWELVGWDAAIDAAMRGAISSKGAA